MAIGALALALSGCTQRGDGLVHAPAGGSGINNIGSANTSEPKTAKPQNQISWPLRDKISSETSGAILNAPSQQMRVEIANTAAERQLGLSRRDSIGSDGLLFVLEKNETPGIWMNDMSFAIDIVWLVDGQVVEVTKNATPEPGVPDAQLTIYQPKQSVDAILEVAAGDAARFGLAVGAQIDVLELLEKL